MSQQEQQAAVRYEIDPAHTGAHFKIRHLMISNVRGEFGKVTGTVLYDAGNPSNSSVEATIDTSTINTRDAQRDQHLKSGDFLDVAKFPETTFRSTQVRKIDDTHYEVTGPLTIHGVSKDVKLKVEGPTPEVKDPWGNTRTGAQVNTKIDRRDFGLTWNVALETGGVLVGNDIEIEIEVELVKKASA